MALSRTASATDNTLKLKPVSSSTRTGLISMKNTGRFSTLTMKMVVVSMNPGRRDVSRDMVVLIEWNEIGRSVL